jgi:hypothetical protein
MKSTYKAGLGIVFLIILIGIITGLYFYNLGHKDLQKASPDFVMSADDLLQAFEDNENEASLKYVNKVIEVTGTVLQLNRGENNSLNITLKTGNALSSLICTMAPDTDPPSLSAGDQITIRGECSGFLMDVLLNNCVVITM